MKHTIPEADADDVAGIKELREWAHLQDCNFEEEIEAFHGEANRLDAEIRAQTFERATRAERGPIHALRENHRRLRELVIELKKFYVAETAAMRRARGVLK